LEAYLDEQKEFLNRKPHTTYAVTEAGRKAFEAHLNALEEIIKGIE
jgi:DNA-binding PadR family transcriptional regulator